MKMRSYNFCHTNTKNPGNNLGIFCLITGRPKLNGYKETTTRVAKKTYFLATLVGFKLIPNGIRQRTNPLVTCHITPHQEL